MATGGLNLSSEFFQLLKAIGESKSKQEEDRIIAKEVARLKQKMESPPSNQTGAQAAFTNPKKLAKEFLVRLLYVSMLGHDNSWGLIRAVEMAASSSLFHKRTGYLVCGACLPPDHEFRFMLVNQMQRDLSSPNVLECSGGVLACTSIITSDMVPAVAGEVTKLLSHDSATIRKKAILCLQRFYQLAPEVVTQEEMKKHVEKALCDKDPAVMGSTLNVIESLSLENKTLFKHIVPSLVAILKQIGDRRLPAEYDYHRLPAPWMQMKLIRILGILGQADIVASQGMYEILNEAMKKADTGINAGYAVVYECVKTIVSIYPNAALLDAAAEAISRFIQSRSNNLKYLGVTGLAMIVESHPKYAAQHQLAVMDCLEDPDETLQVKTLDLLYRMTNPINVEFITEKLVHFLSQTPDLFLKQVLTDRVCKIAERYAPNNAWYCKTITQLLRVSGDLVQQEVAQNLMSLLAEGTGDDDEESDMLLRQTAVEMMVKQLFSEHAGALPKILLETMAWCLGEYGYLSAETSLDMLLEQLCELAETRSLPITTRKCLVTAVMKLVAQAGTCPPAAAAVIDEYTRSKDMDLQARCLEFQTILTHCPHLLPEIFPVDASAEDVQVDPNLSFLDGYVQQCLHQGAKPYDASIYDDDDDDDDGYGYGGASQPEPSFKMTPYEKPQTPAQAMMAMAGAGQIRSAAQSISLPPGSGGGSMISQPKVDTTPQLSLNTRNVANVWGKGGLAPVSQPASTQVATATHVLTPAPAPSWGASTTSVPTPKAPEPPQKTAEQLERERQAAALFGGIVPGAAPVSPAMPPPVSDPVTATSAPPPPAPIAPEVDLLDLSIWDAPASAPGPVVDSFDLAPASPAIVETVSDTEDEPLSVPAPAIIDDPFATMMRGLQDEPLKSFPTASSKFQYNGVPMAPLQITTAQFGQQWGSCAATVPTSIRTTMNLTALLAKLEEVGAYPVEAIAASNEGIAAAMIGGAQLILIHGRVTGSSVEMTIKSTDTDIATSLALFLSSAMD
ncbi:AP-4 complex subunit epsilon-1 [Fistulifera solaris]|uniref:AP-4 complex subunit epsilon-1 n=1 Tax=Fistulifera solaris TaxID=1519565 RepID=A0A1Z5JC70_FISSO|nr:AP-4 complex subunit epsilon-1 [Fistulifera solaris]|eukprot:GAX11610.1 AP-4 complex subunit epsilon-1 [Fistulifera solaris]